MTAPDMTAPTVRPVVGGVYGDRTGRQRGPMFLSAALLHPFRAPGEFYFTAEGFADGKQVRSIYDLITVVSEPGRDAQDEAKGISTKVTQIEICAPETKTLHAVTYRIIVDEGGDLLIKDMRLMRELDMSPAAASAIGEALIRMTEGAE